MMERYAHKMMVGAKMVKKQAKKVATEREVAAKAAKIASLSGLNVSLAHPAVRRRER